MFHWKNRIFSEKIKFVKSFFFFFLNGIIETSFKLCGEAATGGVLKRGVLINFAKFFFNKAARLRRQRNLQKLAVEILKVKNGFSAWKYEKCYSRSSHPEVFLRKVVLKICSRFTGEDPCWSAILTNLQSSLIEITLRHWCSPVNLLQVAEHLFWRTALDGCFCFSDNWKFIWLKEWNQVQVNKY